MSSYLARNLVLIQGFNFFCWFMFAVRTKVISRSLKDVYNPVAAHAHAYIFIWKHCQYDDYIRMRTVILFLS